jgi:thymidylate kinase
MYYHIEGMDLAGKSTVTLAVQKHLGDSVTIRHNTIQSKSTFHRTVDELRLSESANSDQLGVLYLQVLKDDISRFEYPETPTIQDSTVALRSLAWYSAQCNPIEKEFEMLLKQHPKFDSSIVLTANITVRKLRLQSRINENPEAVAVDDLMVLNNPELFLKMEQALVYYSTKYFGSKVIDTSELTKEEVCQIACSSLLD